MYLERLQYRFVLSMLLCFMSRGRRIAIIAKQRAPTLAPERVSHLNGDACQCKANPKPPQCRNSTEPGLASSLKRSKSTQASPKEHRN